MIQRMQLSPIWGRSKRVLGLGLLATMALALGVVLGVLLTSPQYTLVVTAVGVAFCLILAVIDPRLGMLCWIIVAPYARFIPLDIVMGHGIPDLKLGRVITLVLLALWAAQATTGQRKFSRLLWSDIFLVAFTLLTLVSYSGSPWSTKGALQLFWDTWFVPAAAYFLARQLFSTERDVKRIGVALGIVGLYLGLLATHEQTTGIILFYPENRSIIYTTNVRRVVNLLGNPAFLALCLAIAAPFAARGMIESTTRGRRLVWLGVLAAMAVGSFMCYNRSGWAAFVLSLLVMLPFYPRFRKVFTPIFLIGAMSLVIMWGVVSANPAIRERLFAQGPIAGRVQSFTTAWKMIKANPIAGVGQGNYGKLYTLYAHGVAYQYFDPNIRVVASPHNSILYITTQGGFMVLLPYLGFLLSAFWITVRFYRAVGPENEKARSLVVATWGAFVGYLAPGLAADLIAFPYGSVLFYTIIGGVLGWILGEGQTLIAKRDGT
jgi:O-antigen ligase